MKPLLPGKVALVTGGSSGIGRAAACTLADAGASVSIVDWDQTGGQETVRQVTSAGGQARFFHADVGHPEEVAAAVSATVDAFGGLDVVVSNAASYARGDVIETDETTWDRTIAICLKATWALGRAAVPHLSQRGGGAIVVVSSVHAIRGYTRHAAYQAAKAGLLGLTRAMAADFSPEVRVNAVLPGAVVTGLWTDTPPAEQDRIARSCPLRRNGSPEDIAKPILFLASELSGYITATTLVVDGGLTAIHE